MLTRLAMQSIQGSLLEGEGYNGLTLALAAAALLATVAGCWFAWRALLPSRREISITMQPPAALLARESSSVQDVQVAVDGETITQPTIARLEITNRGRHDITSANFHDGRPLRIDLGVPVVRVLEVTAAPLRGDLLRTEIDGTTLKIGPGLLSSGQQLLVQLLVSGTPQSSSGQSFLKHELVDVEVDVRSATERPKFMVPATRAALLAIPLAGLLFLVFWFGSGYYSTVFGPSIKLTPDHGLKESAFVIEGRGFERYSVITASAGDYTNPIAIGKTQADANGSFRIEARAPSKPPGYLEVTVTATYGSGSARFEYAEYVITDDSVK